MRMEERSGTACPPLASPPWTRDDDSSPRNYAAADVAVAPVAHDQLTRTLGGEPVGVCQLQLITRPPPPLAPPPPLHAGVARVSLVYLPSR